MRITKTCTGCGARFRIEATPIPESLGGGHLAPIYCSKCLSARESRVRRMKNEAARALLPLDLEM